MAKPKREVVTGRREARFLANAEGTLADGRHLQLGVGDYSFRLKINIAAPPEPSLVDRLQGRTQPAPVSVQMTLPQLDYRGLMQLRNKEWLAFAGGRSGPRPS